MSLRVTRPGALRFHVFGLCWTFLAAASAAEPPAAVLHLSNGDFVAGELRGSNDAILLGWRSPHFAKGLDFALTYVNNVQFPVPAGPPPKPQGEYCFELADEDTVYGNLLNITEEALELDSPGLGRLHLRRDQVRRFYRW